MLFYSRYQSDDPEDFSVELTRMQASMMLYNGSPIYRKPYLYEMPDTMSYNEMSTALYRTLSGHATLQVKFKYEKQDQHYVQYVQDLPSLEHWQIPVVAIDMLPEIYIITEESSISLLDGYPWRIKFLEYEQHRYLYLEFHAICMDDYSIKCFEDTLFKSLVSGFAVQPGNLSTYRLLRNMEIISSNHIFGLRDLKPGWLGGKENMRMIAVTYSLSEDQLSIVRQISKRYSVDIPVVYQFIVEQVLEYCYDGRRYGIVDNWRSMLRNYDEIGCFNYMSEEFLENTSSLDSHLGLLQDKRKKRSEGEFQSLNNQKDISAVYWYEEELCQHFIQVQADQYCAHDMLIRVRRSQAAAHIQLEIRQESFRKEQIQQCYHRITMIIESLRQQLLESCAS